MSSIHSRCKGDALAHIFNSIRLVPLHRGLVVAKNTIGARSQPTAACGRMLQSKQTLATPVPCYLSPTKRIPLAPEGDVENHQTGRLSFPKDPDIKGQLLGTVTESGPKRDNQRFRPGPFACDSLSLAPLDSGPVPLFPGPGPTPQAQSTLTLPLYLAMANMQEKMGGQTPAIDRSTKVPMSQGPTPSGGK